MDHSNTKCVMVIDENLPGGIIANTAAILGTTLGKCVPDLVGPDVADGSGQPHLGIVAVPVPILKANRELIRSLRSRLFEEEFAELTVVDFSDLAQSCHVYEEFTERIAATEEVGLNYFGIGICGKKKLVNKLTGSMALLR